MQTGSTMTRLQFIIQDSGNFLYCGHLGDLIKCPRFRGKFLLKKHIWDIAKCP